MSVEDSLAALRKFVKDKPELIEKLLATQKSKNPVSDFCALSTQLGFPLYVMDLLSAGEDAYASMRRSTNGGGENSPLLAGEDDYYELFMASLTSI